MSENQPQKETVYFKKRYEELGRPPLRAWGEIAEKHWRENLPGLYWGLKAANCLLEAVILAQEDAADRYTDLVSNQGADPWAALEIAQKEFLYLVSEPESESQEPEDEELSESPLEDLANEQTATAAVEGWLNDTYLPQETLRYQMK